MKRVVFMIFLSLLLFVSEAPAFHIIGEQVKSKLSIQNDFVNPDVGERLTKQKVVAYIKKGDLGLGGEVYMIPKQDYIRFRPYVTLKVSAITPIIGLSTDSKGAEHIDAGLQYSTKFGKLGLFIDLRNYWGVNGGSVDFTDNLVSLSYKFNGDIFSGVDIIYDHYWKSKTDWYLIGIPLGYKLTENVDVFIRPSYEELIPEKGGRTSTQSLRTGVNISF